MKIIFSIFLFLINISLAFSACEDVQVKIIFDRKPVLTKETLCEIITTDKMLFYVSKTCAEKQCEILKRTKKEIVIKDYIKNIGSPGFKLCTELGGVPQIFEFSKNRDLWLSTERCLFGAKDFVEISLLTREWKSFIKKD